MEEKTTMDDFKEELEASFQDTQENDVADITDPAWQTLVQYLEDKTVLTVKIGGIVKSGVVAYVEGIRGFIPASKLSLGYVENLEDWLNKKIQVQVITADPENQKLVLSAKRAASREGCRGASVKAGQRTGRSGNGRKGREHPALRRIHRSGRRSLRTGTCIPDF